MITRIGFLCLIVCGATARSDRFASCAEAAPAQVERADDAAAAPVSSRSQGGEKRRGESGDGSGSGGIKVSWELIAGSQPERICASVSGIERAVLTLLESSRISDDLWGSFFAVYVVNESKLDVDVKDIPRLWGTYAVKGQVMRFEPRFPPMAGVRYRAVFDATRFRTVAKELSPSLEIMPPKSSELPQTADFFRARVTAATTRITAVYPSGDRLPENLLRFYIHFSAPMPRDEAYRHLRLIDLATGKPVHSPFLELQEELWSPDGKRFTLLIDPGRIKRGLKPREMFGPVLEAGKSYRLIVDRQWTDAQGNVLASGFQREFRAGPPDETMPDPTKWMIRSPRAGGREALDVSFFEQLDSALAERLISVVDSAQKQVSGRTSVSERETVWRFIPEAPWRPGEYRLAIGTELEDITGNSVASPFEVDMTTPITKRVAAKRVFLPFSIEHEPGSAVKSTN